MNRFRSALAIAVASGEVRAAQAGGATRDAVPGLVDASRHTATFPALRNGPNPAAAQRAWDITAGRANQ